MTDNHINVYADTAREKKGDRTMKIIVNGNHAQALSEALDKVQANCKARTLTVNSVDRILDGVTKKLDIPKVSMKGTTLVYTGAEKFPNAYKYVPESTQFSATHNGRFWVIESVVRDVCPNRIGNVSLTLSDPAKDAVLRSLERFCV